MDLCSNIEVMHDTISVGPSHAELFDVASGQHGYFTTLQARELGFSGSLLNHHVRSGRFIRIHHGVYRFRDYPSSPREEVMAAWLAAGKDLAIVSHESALDLLELSDVIPTAVHLTIPRAKRYISSMPNTVIHTTTRELLPKDLTVRDGVRLTFATRTILDAAEDGTAPEQVEMAIRQAVDQGLTTAHLLRQDAKARSRRVRRLVEGSLPGSGL